MLVQCQGFVRNMKIMLLLFYIIAYKRVRTLNKVRNMNIRLIYKLYCFKVPKKGKGIEGFSVFFMHFYIRKNIDKD